MEQPRNKDWEVALGQQVGSALVGLALTYSASPWAADTPSPSATTRKADTREIALNLHPARSQPVYSPFHSLGRNYTYETAPEVLHHTHFITDELEILRAGVGMDMSLSEIGNFHINLYSPDGDLNKGKRWTLGAREGQAPIISKKVWSVGGTLEMVKTDPNGSKTLGFIPQLMFNFDDVGAAGSKLQVTFQYEHWKSGSVEDTDRAIPQVHVKWSF